MAKLALIEREKKRARLAAKYAPKRAELKAVIEDSSKSDEDRYFAPARKQEIFGLNGSNVALTICEDAWNDKHFWHKRLYNIDPVEELIRAGGNLVLNISASPFTIHKPDVRRKMLQPHLA